MANGLFGEIGKAFGSAVTEIAKSVAPQDDPNVKMLNAKGELSDLRKKETEVYAEIGRAAYGLNPSNYPQAETLTRILGDIAAAEEKIRGIEQEIKAAEQADTVGNDCPNCGAENAEGVKFCQECGTKLEAVGKFCGGCGAKNDAETNFCRECGNRL